MRNIQTAAKKSQAEMEKKTFTLSTGKQSEPIQAVTRATGAMASRRRPGEFTATPPPDLEKKPALENQSLPIVHPRWLLGVDALSATSAIGFTLIILLELTPHL